MTRKELNSIADIVICNELDMELSELAETRLSLLQPLRNEVILENRLGE